MRRSIVLGDILEGNRRPVDLGDGDEPYPLVGVRLWGKGAFVRERKRGSEIKKKRHYLIKEGDIIYNKLFAWRGAFAIAGEDVNDCFGSDKFPTYKLLDHRVSTEWLSIVFGSQQFAKEAEKRSVGSAAISKFTLNPPRFLELPLHVPSAETQARIVERVVSIDQGIQLVAARIAALDARMASMEGRMFETLTAEAPRAALREIGKLQRRSVTIRDGVKYRQLTIAMNNKGVRFRDEKDGSDIGVKNQAEVRSGDIVFSRIDIRNGAIGVVPPELDGATVANDFPVYSLDDMIGIDFAVAAFAAPDFRAQSVAKSAGSTGRKKMRREAFLDLSIPAPKRAQQTKILQKLSEFRAWASPVRARAATLREHLVDMRSRLIDQLFL